ncbi:hypothetical protein P6F26_04490 [Roseibacterium sp. SDUM158017]|uniref:hypothetical protein n=1 Tax=Roseicyclus salinarum TaxID=3036773 RepID=UPI00241536FE|nr:hypothetical protein [Roseibacterium sp. SDUM158017]MDG4647691.1 hypothetical protein [Roseibacterium sp. SDUM158017]
MGSRWIRRIAVLLVLAALAYPAAGGLVLWRAVSGVLSVGMLSDALAAAPRPDDPLALGYRGDPREALGLDYETVEVRTPLGPAPAWYVPGDAAGAEGGRAAIYVHGIAGAREDGYRALSILAEAGIPTLLVTYRNDPGAPGEPSGAYGFGLTEWRDLEAAVRWMEARGHENLILVAESMGGAISGQFLARSPEAGRIAALALDAPALDGRAVLVHLAAQIGLPFPRLVAPAAELWLAYLGPLDLRGARVVDVVAAFDGPLFLAHGTADRIVPSAISDAVLALREGLAQRGEGPVVSIRTGGDHLMSYAENPQAYRAAFAEFLALPR